MNPNLNPTSYQEVAHFYVGEGKWTPTQACTHGLQIVFKFCVIDMHYLYL